MNLPEITVIDFETTGLNPLSSKVVEIGMVRIRDDKIVDEFASVINPQQPLGSSTFVHGVTEGMAKRAPSFANLAGHILDFCRNSVLVAHNVEFDSKFFNQEFANLDMDVKDLPWYCTLLASRRFVPTGKHRLENTAGYFGIPTVAAHTALGDARVTAEVALSMIHTYDKIANEIGALVPGDLLSLEPVRIPYPRVNGLKKGTEGWLASLIEGMPNSKTIWSTRGDGIYKRTLKAYLQEGKITQEEATQLSYIASRYCLTGPQLRRLHNEVWESLVRDLATYKNTLEKLNMQAKELNLSF